jgi:hypothetical protein
MALVQRQSDREEEEEVPADQTEELQAKVCEDGQTCTAEPVAVQRQTREDESQEEPVQQLVLQLWDCREYDEPTCVQTQEAPPGEQLQAR